MFLYLSSTDDGTSVTHSSAGWSCHSSNEGNNRLGCGSLRKEEKV